MLSNCSQCQYFDHQPNHKNDIRCAIAPAYTSMWLKLKSLDKVTLNSIPVDSCRNFELNPSLEKKEINLPLTWKQWQRLIRDYDHPQSIENALDNRIFEHSLSLTIGDWQAIANSSCDCEASQRHHHLIAILAQQGIEPDESRWIEVDSSCIEAIRFDRARSLLYIRFHSQSVYEYSNFNSELFQDFLDAASKGSFFHLHIKDKFPFSLSA